MNKPLAIDFPELERRARDILTGAGLVIEGALDWSGCLVYAGTTEKPIGKDGRYILHADFPQTVTWYNYRTDGGEKHTEPLYNADAVKLTKQQKAELAETIRQEQSRREEERAERRARAAEQARQIYDASPIAGAGNAYLVRKGVPPLDGLRQAQDGRLIVPVYGADGLQSLQYIGADGDKLFLKDGAIAGGFFPIPAKDGCKDGPLMIGEGYATCMSASLATGYAALVAFNAGNLLDAARYARGLYPAREMLLLADNDCTSKIGEPIPIEKNTGIRAATAAGAAIGAAVAVCPVLDGRRADFNDLHAAQGLDAVRNAIEQARQSIPLPERFYYSAKDNGALMYLKPTGKDDEATPVKVCGHIEFAGRTHGDAWGYLFAFKDRLDRRRRIAIPARLFQVPGAEWAALLADNGLDIEAGMQKAFKECCLAMRDRLPLVRNVERVGWTYPGADDLPAYILPDAVYSARKAAIVFQSGMGALPSLYKQAGTLDGWKQMAELCAGNTRLVFSLCVSFAGTLLNLMGIDGGVFHLEGSSSVGKSTALRLAASVWGNPDCHLRTWRTTDNGLEAILPLFNDNALAMDELGQIGARALSESAYMIANGAGKTRANRGGGAKSIATWRTVILSSGELNLAAKLAEDGQEARAGQLVRFIGVPMAKEHLADLHGMDAGELIAKLNSLCRVHYGTAGRAFLAALVQEMAARDFMNGARKLLEDTADQWAPAGADAQVKRVARRFALVFVAGQYAQWFDILSRSMDVPGAAKACFDDWLKERGSAGEQETAAILEQVKTFLEKNGRSRFQDARYPDDKVINRAGFWEGNEAEGVTYYIFTGVFRQEVIRGYSVKQAVQALRKAGWLLMQDKRRTTINKRLPGMGQERVYAVKPLSDHDAETGAV